MFIKFKLQRECKQTAEIPAVFYLNLIYVEYYKLNVAYIYANERQRKHFQGFLIVKLYKMYVRSKWSVIFFFFYFSLNLSFELQLKEQLKQILFRKYEQIIMLAVLRWKRMFGETKKKIRRIQRTTSKWKWFIVNKNVHFPLIEIK